MLMDIRKSLSVLSLLLAWSAAGVWAQATAGQAPAPAAQQTPAAATPAPAAPATAADLLMPSLSSARSTLMALKLDKWKKGTVREEAESNIDTLVNDLNNNMQPLVEGADTSPGQLSKAIPLIKHLDAFYDVLLRVEEASRVSAPADQIGALQDALLQVSHARIAYDDVLQSLAAGQEKQIGDLQTAVRAEQQSVKDAEHQVEVAKASAKAEPCKPATTAHRRRRSTAAKKPAVATPKTPTAQTQQQKPQ